MASHRRATKKLKRATYTRRVVRVSHAQLSVTWRHRFLCSHGEGGRADLHGRDRQSGRPGWGRTGHVDVA